MGGVYKDAFVCACVTCGVQLSSIKFVLCNGPHCDWCYSWRVEGGGAEAVFIHSPWLSFCFPGEGCVASFVFLFSFRRFVCKDPTILQSCLSSAGWLMGWLELVVQGCKRIVGIERSKCNNFRIVYSKPLLDTQYFKCRLHWKVILVNKLKLWKCFCLFKSNQILSHKWKCCLKKSTEIVWIWIKL